jgi:LacI family transcriptional regulator
MTEQATSVHGGAVVTIKDVAREAGVSPATVSRVLNGTKVDPALEDRVRDAVRRLGYRPSGVARSLRTRRTSVWGLVISEVRNPFFTDIISAVEEAAQASGYFVVVCNSDHSVEKERRYLELIASERMAGAIVTPSSSVHSDLGPLHRQGVPVVLVDRGIIGEDRVDSVLVDGCGGAHAAVSHLVESGYMRIACITGPLHTTPAMERLAGYRRAIEQSGESMKPELVVEADFREPGGYGAAMALLARPEPPDALFVANNLMTLGALRAINELGLRMPDQFGLVGFDDLPWAPLVQPPLSTVEQPIYDLGRETARLLLRRIAGEQFEPVTLSMRPTLRIRGTSARHATGLMTGDLRSTTDQSTAGS